MWGLLICSIIFRGFVLKRRKVMQILAPLIIVLALSASLYKTIDVWPKTQYDLQKIGATPQQATDVVALRGMVEKKQITPDQAEGAFKQKYQTQTV